MPTCARQLATIGQDLHAPCLMASEVANALWREARVGEMERRAAGILLATRAEAGARRLWIPAPRFRGDKLRGNDGVKGQRYHQSELGALSDRGQS